MSAFVSWSGGKDGALALHRARQQGIEVKALLTMFDESGGRSRSHAVPREVMQAQADALRIPLVTANAGWADYEAVFKACLRRFADEGITQGIFGDIDLVPHREWEERVCAAAGLTAHLPLWDTPRVLLSQQVLTLGFKPLIVCVNARWLDASFCGVPYDAAYLARLPPEVDACGENGEFHSFVTDGPGFTQAVPVEVVQVYSHAPAVRPREDVSGYHYAELQLIR